MLDATPPCRLDANPQDVGKAGAATPMPGGSRQGWAVVEAYSQREQLALRHLTEQQFDAYLPLCHTAKGLRPLFAPYLFVFLSPDTPWRSILYTIGVFDLIRSKYTGFPTLCPTDAVEALQAGEALRRIPTTTEASWRRPGASVRLTGGGLNGHHGVIHEVGRHNALVTLLLFGHLRHVNVPLDALTPRSD